MTQRLSRLDISHKLDLPIVRDNGNARGEAGNKTAAAPTAKPCSPFTLTNYKQEPIHHKSLGLLCRDFIRTRHFETREIAVPILAM